MGRKQGGGTSIHSVIAFPTGSFDHLDPGTWSRFPMGVQSQFEAPVKKLRC